jgi:hypothetical protein
VTHWKVALVAESTLESTGAFVHDVESIKLVETQGDGYQLFVRVQTIQTLVPVPQKAVIKTVGGVFSCWAEGP